ncbi:CUB-like domain-containing protein [Caenorhabditis elegans]|uniref:CUB-like domain-containing protein n=1 Tax=Caenorhabditis elegans TaxID=6239 RepID=O17947_CAEEL|nr:CUB-like domain-containing protein [Caenorhabditis elegans]CAB03523.3 CUB-like domain-containing protein [Caenorhabditis elegans]|eukprot:NP_502491.3 Uncharacterized protein CELE_K10D11.4 [Caenorhabditis elegans]
MILLGFLLIFAVFGDDVVPENACLEKQVVEPKKPVNSSEEFEFPNNKSVVFLANKSCSWVILVPGNFFVILYINATVPPAGRIRATQAPNHTESFTDTHVEVALLFVAPSFELNWFSGNSSSGGINFSVQWQPFTENMTSQNYTLEKGGSSVVLDHEDTYSPVVFKAATKVSILCLPGYRREEDTYLRTGIVFDGPNVNSPFLGSLYSISQSHSQLLSSGSTVTIFSIVPIPSHHHVIVQDASMYENISQISSLNLNEFGVEVVHLNASSGKSVLFTHIKSNLIDEYLISVEIDKGAELQVYFEGLKETQKVATYTSKNNGTNLPQKLQGSIRYYMLTSGKASLSLTRDKGKSNWEHAFAGRKGFLTSKYWKNDNPELEQDSFHFIGVETKNSTLYKFLYRVLEADLAGDNSVHLVVADNAQRILYYDHRSATEYTNDTEWHSHYGHSISLVYSSNTAVSKGFFAEFEISSAFQKFSIWILICNIVIYLV